MPGWKIACGRGKLHECTEQRGHDAVGDLHEERSPVARIKRDRRLHFVSSR
jgi:hypothetical protein